jgi:hypothetical protein
MNEIKKEVKISSNVRKFFNTKNLLLNIGLP